MPKLKQTDKYTYEAALDLGASPLYAFFKVVFPDIMPGVLSGFLLAFTMSLDDFIITHFTKGAGINTLSTLIYSEVRRGIRPVSYTHLDVYKRQPRESAIAPKLGQEPFSLSPAISPGISLCTKP